MKIDPPPCLLPRTGIAAIAILLVACAARITSPVATATSGPSVRPTPTEVGGPAAGPCTIGDVELAHGRVEGAAGSRFTTMSITVVGPATCTIPLSPTVRLLDATGAEVAIGVRAGAIPDLELPVGASASSDVQLANWCDPPPAEPLTLALVLGDVSLSVEGGPYPDPGELPGCNGGGGLTFAATDWRLP